MIYLDNHSTTRVDPDVVAAMLPTFTEEYANPGSTTHEFGRSGAARVNASVARMASLIGADASELVMTSGATESNNLSIFGTCLHPRQDRKRIVTVATEHRAILDPANRLSRHGFEVVYLPVVQQGSNGAGRIILEEADRLIDGSVALVSVMLANNEIGVLQPIAELAKLCRAHGCWLHTDATQAVGRMPINVDALDVDLLSFSAHKFYGPKGIGGLYVRNRDRRVRLDPQILGGGHQGNRRSGTLPVSGIVGMAAALEKCDALSPTEPARILSLRDNLFSRLKNAIPDLKLNGPELSSLRLGGNLNCEFPGVEGESIMQTAYELAVSSGSACTSAEPKPSHVLTAIGLTEDQARSSLRFGIGRFNTEEEIVVAAKLLSEAYWKLRYLVTRSVSEG